jgi:cell division protein FtsL
MLKKLLVIVIIIVALVILVGLMRQIYTALGSDKRFNQVLEDVNKLEKENKDLKKQLAQAESLDSVEEIARDDLNMSLPNETIVVVPEELINKVLTPPEKPIEVKEPNWQGWVNLFIH